MISDERLAADGDGTADWYTHAQVSVPDRKSPTATTDDETMVTAILSE